MIAVAVRRALTRDQRVTRGRESGVVAVLILAGLVANPDRPLPFEICPWKILSGHPCWTCGLTRSVCHSLHGDWHGALMLHPAGPAVLMLAAGWMLWAAAEAWCGRSLVGR